MAPNIDTSTHGNTLTVRLSGPLDRRIASSLFSRFLSAKSGYDDLIVDITDVDEVSDTGLAVLRLLRTRAREAGKRLAVVDRHQDDHLMRFPAQFKAASARRAIPSPGIGTVFTEPW